MTVFLLLWPCCIWAADAQKDLADAVALIGPERNWNNQTVVKKLRDIRLNYSQTSQAVDATALLALCLTQIPGDHAEETFSLCDEVQRKAPRSWQVWVANIARMATWGLRQGENQKTLDAALVALTQTNGIELSRNPDPILKPLMDQLPPAPTDFTDQIDAAICQQALILGQYKLGTEHLDRIANPQLKAFGERCMARYIREHPNEAKKHKWGQ